MSRKSLLLALIVVSTACSDQTSIAPATSTVQTVRNEPRIAGYFSVGCEVERTTEQRILEGAARPRRAVVVGRVLPAVTTRGGTRRFRRDVIEDEYQVRLVGIQIARVLYDPNRILPVGAGSLDLTAMDFASVRRFDGRGRLFVPFPGSDFRLAPDARGRVDGDSVFLVEEYDGELFITASAFVEHGEVVGDRETIPLDSLVERVVELRVARSP